MGRYKIKVGIIGGSGMEKPETSLFGKFTKIKSEEVTNDFGKATSELHHGTISGVDVVLLSRHGPGHKISPSNINYRANIEALRSAGCTHVITSSACGSLSESIDRGDIVIPNSFIDRTNGRKGTFFDGSSGKYAGVCHLPMEPCFDQKTSQLLVRAAQELNLKVRNGGTIVTIEGPRFSSKAESNMFRMWGGHLVGMTCCPEVMLAKEAGILYGSIMTVTDFDCWKDEVVNPADVIECFKQNAEKVSRLIIKAVELIGQEKWDEEIDNLAELIKNCNCTTHN